jgi:hypothetical protein
MLSLQDSEPILQLLLIFPLRSAHAAFVTALSFIALTIFGKCSTQLRRVLFFIHGNRLCKYQIKTTVQSLLLHFNGRTHTKHSLQCQVQCTRPTCEAKCWSWMNPVVQLVTCSWFKRMWLSYSEHFSSKKCSTLIITTTITARVTFNFHTKCAVLPL